MEITWEVEDGYMGGSAPQTLTIDDCECEDYDSQEEFEAFVYDCVREDFETKVSYGLICEIPKLEDVKKRLEA